MLKTAHLMATLLLLSSVTIANRAIAESLRDVAGTIMAAVGDEGKIFALADVRTTRPEVLGGDPLVEKLFEIDVLSVRGPRSWTALIESEGTSSRPTGVWSSAAPSRDRPCGPMWTPGRT